MKKSFIGSSAGFTLSEIIVAVTISVLVLGGVLGFLTKLQTDVLLSKESTRVHTSLTDFVGTMNNLSKLYASGSVLVQGTGTYNVGLLVRPDKTSGVLIGVVEEKSGNTSKLDQNKAVYGKKVLAYQKLTAGQVSSILAATGTVYDVPFFDEGLFPNLLVTDFLITPYNSGAILEYELQLETPFYEGLVGKNRSEIEPKVMDFSFTLDF